jgi:hypothetical protein
VSPYYEHGTNNGTHDGRNENKPRNAGQAKMKATVSVIQEEMKAAVRANNEETKATINPIWPGLGEATKNRMEDVLVSVDLRTRGLREELNEDCLSAEPHSTHC